MKEITRVEQDWLKQAEDNALAKLCLFYARSINLLDIKWITSSLSSGVTYSSQSVFETLKGREEVIDYLSKKVESLRDSDKTVRAELAVDRSGQPCVAIYQASGSMDQNWLSSPIGTMTFKVNDLGEATELFMITCVPSPESVIRSGIFPGCPSSPVADAHRIIRATSSYEDMEIAVYVLDPMTSLDRAMVKEVENAIVDFPGAKMRLAAWGENSEGANQELAELGFTGFPSLAVRWQNKVIYRHQGLIRAESFKRSMNECLE